MAAVSTAGRVPHVVIVGGGFGGLYAARKLGKAPVRVTLVDKHNYHLFRPMIYQVATGLLSADEIAAPLRGILRNQSNTDVLMAEVTAVDMQRRVVRIEQDEIPYDYLILATGIHYNYFGHEEWKKFAPGLDSVDDADRIRGKILLAFEAAEKLAATENADPSLIQELLTFVIVGAGTAGVEMAGTIAGMTREAMRNDFRHINPAHSRILLYEALPRILSAYPESLAAKARQHLEQIGVKVFTNTPVAKVDKEGIVVHDARIPSRTVIWCAGVQASSAAQWLGTETDRHDKVKVGPDLSVPGHPDVFVIGDTASIVAETRNLFGFKRKKPEPMPGVAQPAIQEGQYVAGVIRRRLEGRPPAPPFWYWDKGNLAIVGRTYAIADLECLRFSGFPAWVLWAVVHIYFLIGFSNRLLVMLRWGGAFLTRSRNVRIFPLDQQTFAAIPENTLPLTEPPAHGDAQADKKKAS
jgi:NADH:quinone reductase (non-electrogenic)